MAGKVTAVAAPPTETRHIVLAQGIQFNNPDLPPDEQIPGGSLKTRMAAAGTPLTIVSATEATFSSVKQGVNYTIKVVFTKSEFKAALESDKTNMAIYDGHSRFGRGACFGTIHKPSNDWENGTTPNTTGLFRMGFPYVAAPMKDISDHGYTIDIAPTTEKLAPADCEPDLRAALSARLLGAHTLKDVAAVASQITINGLPLAGSDKFWGFNWGGEGFSVVAHAGWKNTVSTPMDLGATTMKCRAFCHFGCSSFQHYQPVVRTLKKFTQVSNKDNFAFFTSDLSLGYTTPSWLFHLLSYDQFNAGQPWQPWLAYAVRKANKDIKKGCTASKDRIYSIVQG